MTLISPSHLRPTHAFAWLGLIALTFCMLVATIKPSNGIHGGIEGNIEAQFSNMVDGTAHKPYVYRMLVPLLIRSSTAIASESVQTEASRYVETHRWSRKAFKRFGWQESNAFAYFVACGIMFMCWLAYAIFCAKLAILTAGLHNKPLYVPLLGMLALYVTAHFFRYVAYIYDPAQLFLFTASLYYLARMSLGRFVIFFFLTALNKETSVLLIPIFALYGIGQTERRQYFRILISLILIFIGIKGFLFVHFYDNPGHFVLFHLFDHNLMPVTWLKLLLRSGFFVLLLVLAFWDWNHRPHFLRIALVCTLLPLITLCAFLGYIDEWRDYYETVPILFAMMIDFFHRLQQKRIA